MRRYLLHYAYAGTLQAFDKDASLLPCSLSPSALKPLSCAKGTANGEASSDPACKPDGSGSSSGVAAGDAAVNVSMDSDVDMQGGDDPSDRRQQIDAASGSSFSDGCSSISSRSKCAASRWVSERTLSRQSFQRLLVFAAHLVINLSPLLAAS